MNQDPENFENLRKLLALKRHEQPPPGYFDRLPRTILSRIEAEKETKSSVWDRLLPGFILRPAFAWGFGVAACAMLTMGGYYALRTDSGTGAPGASAPMANVQPISQNPSFVAVSSPGQAPVVTNENVSSTNPITQGPLFPDPTLRTAPVNFSKPNP